jgi:hypothetical protein
MLTCSGSPPITESMSPTDCSKSMVGHSRNSASRGSPGGRSNCQDEMRIVPIEIGCRVGFEHLKKAEESGRNPFSPKPASSGFIP